MGTPWLYSHIHTLEELFLDVSFCRWVSVPLLCARRYDRARGTASGNHNWSLIFSSFLTTGRNTSVVPERRTMAAGRQVEGQEEHFTRKPLWPEASSFVKKWTDRRGQAAQVWTERFRDDHLPVSNPGDHQANTNIPGLQDNRPISFIKNKVCSELHYIQFSQEHIFENLITLGFQLNFMCKRKWHSSSLLTIIFKTWGLIEINILSTNSA